MYQYDEFDQALVDQRCLEFRHQVQRRLKGELTEDEFKPLRLMNGLYLQLHAYMLRVAIPYGVLSAEQMKKLAFIADTYDKGYGHFTTRQNIQFNWPQLSDTPDILETLATVQMHAIQTSGNCIRNITTDPFAGVAADEEVDPRPIAEWLRQWSTLHPEFRYLPRKFKFAITGSVNDRAAIKLHDIGLRLKRNEAGETVVDVWVGGGQGRTPKIAQLFKPAVALDDLLPYLEAILRVYNLHGRRDNKYKARIKILLAETGLEKLQSQVEEAYAAINREEFADSVNDLTRITARFIQPDLTAAGAVSEAARPVWAMRLNSLANNADIDAHERKHYTEWLTQCVKEHTHSAHASVVISLKKHGDIPGDMTSAQMRGVAAIAQAHGYNEIRVTHRQNLVLPQVAINDLVPVWRALQQINLAVSNVDLPSDIIACPGLDYCALATARSIPIAQDIAKTIENVETGAQGMTVNISGCINACAHHHVASIGILGLDRGGVENYQITLGGQSDEAARLGDRMGPGIAAADVAPTVERIVHFYKQERLSGERFNETYQRLGKAPFISVIYGEEHVAKTA
jgi:sulfite reductase (NADPH) hemoprotein beta-component